jgi:hypothetical protein
MLNPALASFSIVASWRLPFGKPNLNTGVSFFIRSMLRAMMLSRIDEITNIEMRAVRGFSAQKIFVAPFVEERVHPDPAPPRRRC